MPFSLVVAESDILAVDVPVARFQLTDQRAFGYLPTPQKAVRANIVGKRGKEQAVFPELPEHRAELPQVFPQERVRLPFRHGACRIPFPRQKFMPVPYIRVMLFRAFLTAVAWSVFSYLFSLYFTFFPDFSIMYGSLSTLILVMVWLYFCMNLLLYGAEINAYFESQFRQAKLSFWQLIARKRREWKLERKKEIDRN